MNAGREWQFGNHRAVLEEPDIIRVTFNGPMVFEDAHRVLAIYREVCAERPLYLVADIGRSSLDAATRKYLGAELRPEWFLGVVYVGANLMLRVITNGMISLVHFRRGSTYDIRYVADEEGAQKTLEAWRKEHAAKSANREPARASVSE